MSEVAWLGGGTGSGKSTVARLVAARLGLRLYPLDAFWYAHAAQLGEEWPPPDEQWLAQTPAQQADEFERTSRRRLALVVSELARLPPVPATLVEGPQVLPDALPRGARVVVLDASAAFRRAVLESRGMPPTSDPPRALASRLAKDDLYAARVRALAVERGIPLVRVDGTATPDEVTAEVAALLFPEPPPVPARAELAAARRWQNDAVAANLRAWLASDSAPLEPLGAFPFACECGAIGCAETVMVRLEDLERTDCRIAAHRAPGQTPSPFRDDPGTLS